MSQPHPNATLFEVTRCKACNSDEVSDERAGDETLTVCRSCRGIEQGTYITYEDEDGHTYNEVEYEQWFNRQNEPPDAEDRADAKAERQLREYLDHRGDE